MSSLEQRRRSFKRYKRDVEKRGKPFFPYAMFHDTVMSLVVVLTILVVTLIWYYTADEGKAGWLGKLYDDKAEPGTTTFIPRPDWYFYFLFYLLRIFKWPDSVILGTVGIPTILILILLAIPFVDTRLERRILRRPVIVVTTILVVLSMGVLTYKGATVRELLPTELAGITDEWAQKQGFAGNREAVGGAKLFTEAGCLTCHVYLGTGSQNLGAPDLSREGTRNRGVQWQIDHLKCPSCLTAGSPMPAFAQLGDDNLRKLAVFLEASKGEK